MYLDFFQRKKDTECNDNTLMREDNIFNKLIFMNDLLGLADKLDNFANFLTVSIKFNFTSVYIFHTFYPTRSNWQMILSQIKSLTFSLALYKPHQ